MKKKIIALLASLILVLPMITFTVSAVQPRWSLLNSASAICHIADNKYVGDVTALNTVNRMDIDIILYEKGLFSSYKEVSSIHKTVYHYSHTAIGDYSFSSLKDYKIEMTVKAYTQSGQTETVTVSNEYT